VTELSGSGDVSQHGAISRDREVLAETFIREEPERFIMSVPNRLTTFAKSGQEHRAADIKAKEVLILPGSWCAGQVVEEGVGLKVVVDVLIEHIAVKIVRATARHEPHLRNAASGTGVVCAGGNAELTCRIQ